MINILFRKTERGDADSYYVSALIYILFCLIFLCSFYVLDEKLLQIWGDRDTLYLEQHRYISAKVWRCLFRMRSSILFWWLPAMWLFATFLFQFALKPELARIVNKIYSRVLFVVALGALLTFYSLLIGPQI